MYKGIKILSIVILAFTITACGNGNGEMDEDEETSEEVTSGMEHHWMDQREEFIDLAEIQLDEWEERIEELEGDRSAELKDELDEIREKLSDLEQSAQEDWEDMRQEIAGDINNLREKIEAAE